MLVESITTGGPTEAVPVEAIQQLKVEAEAPQETSEPSSDKKEGAGRDAELLKDVLEVAQNHLQISDVGLDFSVHGDTGRIKVSVTDRNTGDLIREIPPEQILNLMAKLDEMMGILYDEKV
jgi:flagellar protein FlaG